MNRSLFAAFALQIALCLMVFAGCGSEVEVAEGAVTSFYQPLRSGMVQSYVTVKLDDGTEVHVRLPQDDDVWDRLSDGARRGNMRIEIRRESSEQAWEYVQVVECIDQPHSTPLARIRSIAVLPLENLSGDSAHESFVDGVTEALISNITDIGAFDKVIPLASVIEFKRSDKELSEIARDLGVDAVLEGTVRRMESRVRLTVQLVYVPTDFHVWSEHYDRDLEGFSEVVRDAATKVSDIASEPLGIVHD